jgi:hypothetical protein
VRYAHAVGGIDRHWKREGEKDRLDGFEDCLQGECPVKLPRFGGVFDGFVDYGSVVATSIIASYAIGER